MDQSKVALGSARLFSFAAAPAHFNVLNIVPLSYFAFPTHTQITRLVRLNGIPVVVLLREATGALLEIYICRNTPVPGRDDNSVVGKVEKRIQISSTVD